MAVIFSPPGLEARDTVVLAEIDRTAAQIAV
jgi:hypothetical protein